MELTGFEPVSDDVELPPAARADVEPRRFGDGHRQGPRLFRFAPNNKVIPAHLKGRRRKHHEGRITPQHLDGATKRRIMDAGRRFKRCRIKGRPRRKDGKRGAYTHYGPVTGKAVEILWALLYRFHGPKGLCFPGYERLMEAADCSRDMVWRALQMLEDVGLLSWDHRYKLELVEDETVDPDLWGRRPNRVRAFRTSNAYRFFDPETPNPQFQRGNSCKSEHRTRTPLGRVSSPSFYTPDANLAAKLAALPSAKKLSEQQLANLSPPGA